MIRCPGERAMFAIRLVLRILRRRLLPASAPSDGHVQRPRGALAALHALEQLWTGRVGGAWTIATLCLCRMQGITTHTFTFRWEGCAQLQLREVGRHGYLWGMHDVACRPLRATAGLSSTHRVDRRGTSRCYGRPSLLARSVQFSRSLPAAVSGSCCRPEATAARFRTWRYAVSARSDGAGILTPATIQWRD